MSVIYCPRCDKRIIPDHRCLSRRHFFGMLAGAAALLAAPKPELPSYDLLASPPILRAGDRLMLNINGLPSTPLAWSVTLEHDPIATIDGRIVTKTFAHSGSDVNNNFFVAARDYTITDIRVLVGGTVRRVPIEITRSGK